MTRVVFDTNVLISSLFWKGPSRDIVDLAIAHKIKSITSQEILEELEAVLYEDFQDIPYKRIEEIVRDVLSYSEVATIDEITVKGLRDFKDAKIIATAKSAKADYIVTGDKDLLVLNEVKNIRIVNPRAFLEIFK